MSSCYMTLSRRRRHTLQGECLRAQEKRSAVGRKNDGEEGKKRPCASFRKKGKSRDCGMHFPVVPFVGLRLIQCGISDDENLRSRLRD